MPKTDVVMFADVNGEAPLLRWFERIPVKARDKCVIKIERLAQLGYELRRPENDFLRDGIYELRAALNHVQYRVLYFFHDHLAVLSHGCTKEDRVPDNEIAAALRNKNVFGGDPETHTYKE